MTAYVDDKKRPIGQEITVDLDGDGQQTSYPGSSQIQNAVTRAEIRAERQECNATGGFFAGGQCRRGEDAVAYIAGLSEDAPAYERGQEWLADYYEGTDAGTGPDVEETTEVVETGTDPQQQIDDFQAQIDELFTPGKFTVEGIEDGEPIVVIQNEDGTSTTIVGIEELQEYEEEAAAAAEEAAAQAAEEAAEEVSSAISDAVSEGDFETAEQIAKDYNEEYGEIYPDIAGEANKDVGVFEEAYKDRERQAEQAEKEEEQEQVQDNSGIEVDWADYEIVGQREDGCYDVREKSSGTVFVACPGDVVDGVSVDTGDDIEEGVLDDTTDDDETEDGGGLTFGGGALVKDLIEEGAETEQKDKESTETEQKDKDAEETEKDVAEQLLKDAEQEQKDKDVEKEEEVAEETEPAGQEGLTFGGGSVVKDVAEEVVEEVVDDGGETELEIALDPTKDGGGDGGEDPGDQGFTFGGGSDTKDTVNNNGSEQAEKDSEEAEKDAEEAEKDSEETEPAGQVGLTFGGGSVVKDTKDGTGSSDTEGGKDGTGDSDTEGGKDGTGDSDSEGKDGTGDSDSEGEEQAESLFGLTKDGGASAGGTGLGFNSFMAGISYESPTIQNIVQSPNVDYMAQLNKIINKGMLV